MHLVESIEEQKERAEAEFDQGNYRQAAELFAAVYQEEQSLALNRQLVLALQADEQYQLAREYASDFLSDYAQHENLFLLYFNLLLQTQNFVFAQQWAMQRQGERDRLELLEDIRAKEKQAEDQQSQTLKTIAQQFYHLSDENLSAQQERYQQAFHLPVATFITGAKFLLVDPFSTPLMRATLLADLQQLAVKEAVQYQWLDGQRYQVNLTEIASAFADDRFVAMMAALDEQVGQEDPVAYQALFDQIRLETMLIFPRLAESVVDPVAWIEADVAAFYQEDDVTESAEQQAIHGQVHQALLQLGVE